MLFYEMMKNKILLIASVLIGFGLADAAFRLYEYLFLTCSYQPEGDVVDLHALNYNDSSVSKSKQQREYRVLSFGDSFCFGIVQYPYTYNGVASALLNKADHAKTTRIVNLGEPSSSFIQYLKSMENWSPILEHDAIIVNVFIGNDLTDIAYDDMPDDAPINRAFGDNFVDAQTGRKRLNYVPHKFPLRMLDYAYAYYVKFTEGDYVLRDIPPPYNFALGPLDGDRFDRMALVYLDPTDPEKSSGLRKGYQGFVKLAKALNAQARKGTKILFMISPSQIQIDKEFQERLRGRFGLDFTRYDLDLPDYLIQETIEAVCPQASILRPKAALVCAIRKGKDLYYPHDIHWNVEGNKLVGQTLARFMQTQWFNDPFAQYGELDECALGMPVSGEEIPSTVLRRKVFSEIIEPLL